MIPVSLKNEREALMNALPNCKLSLDRLRIEGDTLAAALTESDMNVMLERLFEIGTGDTEATGT